MRYQRNNPTLCRGIGQDWDEAGNGREDICLEKSGTKMLRGELRVTEGLPFHELISRPFKVGM
jgi:hypothetical protein